MDQKWVQIPSGTDIYGQNELKQPSLKELKEKVLKQPSLKELKEKVLKQPSLKELKEKVPALACGSSFGPAQPELREGH
jgi:hypothetical protein